MTITEADRETFQSKVDDFQPQIHPDQCLPTALKNILDEMAERHSGKQPLSLSDLDDICEYERGFASVTQNIHARLNPEIEDSGVEVKTARGLNVDDLDAIIEDQSRSLPIVELHEDYFESIEDYDPRGGSNGYQWFHVVIPFSVNDEDILFYDPYSEILLRSSRIDTPPTERSQKQFYEWWTAASGRWTLWVEQKDQQTITSSRFESDAI